MEVNNKNKESFVAQWFEGNFTDTEAKEHLSDKDFLEYKHLLAGLKSFEKAMEPKQASFKSIREQINQQQTKRKLFNRYTIASLVAVLVVCFGLSFLMPSSLVSIKADTAFQKASNLIDGSELLLNAKSELSYDTDTWDTEREVYLHGQAYFKVKHGSVFTIKTALGTVQVLGTKFDVTAVDDYFEVKCYEGKVEVLFNDERTILTAGKSVRSVNENQFVFYALQTNKPSWIQGESRFRSVPLKYVIQALERQYDLQFDTQFIDQTIVFTGSFRHDNLDLALAAIFKSVGIRYKNKTQNIYVLSHNL